MGIGDQYHPGMKSNTKSSITLPPGELALVLRLKRRLSAKTNVEVVRMGLRLLDERSRRDALREAFRQASLATRPSTEAEMSELDHLAGEGLDG
jgi:hypothetical protein